MFLLKIVCVGVWVLERERGGRDSVRAYVREFEGVFLRQRDGKSILYLLERIYAHVFERERESGNRLCLPKLWKQSSCFKLYRLNFTVIISHETK